jgi:hypothetical protein
VWSLARNNAKETEGGVFVKIWLAAKLPFECTLRAIVGCARLGGLLVVSHIWERQDSPSPLMQ